MRLPTFYEQNLIPNWGSISTQGYDCLVVEVTLEYEKGMNER